MRLLSSVRGILALPSITASCGLLGCDEAPPADLGGGDAGPDGSPIDVHGAVVDGSGAPYLGAAVYVVGHGPTTSGAAGAFEVVDVVPPYDILIAAPGLESGVAYLGLSSESPVLTVIDSPPRENTTTLDATLSFGAGSLFVSPNPAETRTRTIASLVRGSGSTLSQPSQQATMVSFSATWFGGSSTTGTLHSVQYTLTDGIVTSLRGYGEASLFVSDGVPEDVGTVTMEPVTEAALEGQVTVEGSHDLSSISGQVRFADGASFSIGSITGGDGSFAMIAPDLVGATGTIHVSAIEPGATSTVIVVRASLPLPSTDLEITIPDVAAPAAIAPQEGAGNVGPGTELRVVPVAGAVYLHRLVPEDGTGASLTVMTAEDRFALPDFGPFAVVLASGEQYEWTTRAYVGDELADANELLATSDLRRDVVVSLAEVRTLIAE